MVVATVVNAQTFNTNDTVFVKQNIKTYSENKVVGKLNTVNPVIVIESYIDFTYINTGKKCSWIKTSDIVSTPTNLVSNQIEKPLINTNKGTRTDYSNGDYWMNGGSNMHEYQNYLNNYFNINK